MKGLLILVLFGFYLSAPAQITDKELIKHQQKIEKSLTKKSAVVSLDTLFNEGKPYCLFVESDKLLGTAYKIIVKDLMGADVMWCQYENNTAPGSTAEGGYEISFSRSGEQAFYKTVIGMSLEKEIVKSDMFTNGEFNPAAVAKFIAFNKPKKEINNITIINTGPNTPYTMVERNRSALLQIFGESIQQDFKTIGALKEVKSASDGKIYTQLTISLPNGIVIATAKKSSDENEWNITTAKDNEFHSVATEFGNEKKDVVSYLVNRLYL